jgi:hypothetical protein
MVVGVINVVGHIMGIEQLMFEVHYRGNFNRENRCAYVGGYVNNYPGLYDGDKLSFSFSFLK